MPGAPGQVFVDVQIAVREDIQAGAFLVVDEDGHGVLEFFAEADIQHAGIEGAAPHADVKPARAGKGSCGGGGQKEIGGSGEHELLQPAL